MTNIYERVHTQNTSIRTNDKSELSEVYQAARDLEVQNLAERMARMLGRGSSDEFAMDVATAFLQQVKRCRR